LHRPLFVFRLFVGILPALFFGRNTPCLQKQDKQYAAPYTRAAQALTADWDKAIGAAQ